MKIKFVAPFLDHSGYGESARNTLIALNAAGIEVTTTIVSYSNERLEHGQGAELAKKFQDTEGNYKIKIIEATPENYLPQLEPLKYHIGFMFWEVLGIDPYWVWCCNKMDEIWICSWMFAKTLKDSGVKVPIRVVPQAISTTIKKNKPFKIPEHKGFLFYSIFQWTERKNPKALIQTYLKTFEGNDGVSLLVKTYRGNFSESEKQAIRNDILLWKRQLRLKHYPRIFLALDPVSNEEMARIHDTGDCYVSAHRGEGWGMPQMEAMLHGKPIISTNFGGIHEFMTKNQLIAGLAKYKLIPVFNMKHIPWYNKNQKWADVDTKDLSAWMLLMYSARGSTQKIGKPLEKYVKANFNYKIVGKQLKELLKAI